VCDKTKIPKYSFDIFIDAYRNQKLFYFIIIKKLFNYKYFNIISTLVLAILLQIFYIFVCHFWIGEGIKEGERNI